jgi:phosphoribosylglycinamide formyltransferase-1
VDEELDHGAIIVQRAIEVLESDDAHSLARRILAEEHIAYSEAIARVASGDWEIRGRRYVKAGNKGTRE